MQLGCSWQELPQIALRFCFSRKEVSSVLLGVRNREELNQGVEAWSQGPLSEKLLRRTPALALNEENWVNPSYWPIP
jgi:aryl-alcohol dehydrogenase-like predicted oxidoreductase